MIFSWKLQLDYDLLVLSPHLKRRASEGARETGQLVMDVPNTAPSSKRTIRNNF